MFTLHVSHSGSHVHNPTVLYFCLPHPRNGLQKIGGFFLLCVVQLQPPKRYDIHKELCLCISSNNDIMYYTWAHPLNTNTSIIPYGYHIPLGGCSGKQPPRSNYPFFAVHACIPCILPYMYPTVEVT